MKKWYALYTNHKHEKRVQLQLASRNIETYLPLYSSLRTWKDRKAWIDLPVFPNYIFIFCSMTDYYHELKRMRGIIRVVGYRKVFRSIKLILSKRFLQFHLHGNI